MAGITEMGEAEPLKNLRVLLAGWYTKAYKYCTAFPCFEHGSTLIL